jgi:hypothetical protein
MNERVFQVDGSGEDGAFIWWEPGSVLIDDLREAYEKVNRVHLLPKTSNAASAIKDAFSAFIDACNIKVRGRPIKIEPLADNVLGCEAVQVERGEEENFREFVMSVAVDKGIVRILKHNPQFVPQVDNHKAQIEAAIQKVYDSKLNWWPTTQVSSAVARLIDSLGGILVRQTGGNYFLPEAGLKDFIEVCDRIEKSQTDLLFTVTKFPLKPNERSFRCVCDAVKRIAAERLAVVEESLKDLGTKKQRANGVASRTAECMEVKDMLDRYGSLLGVTFQDLKDAAQKVEDAVCAHAAMDFTA